MRRYYFPTNTPLALDVVEIEMTLPTGELGIRHYGQRVILLIDRDFGVEVREAVFGQRVILRGAMNCGSMYWENLSGDEKTWEVCRTALEMIEARLDATAKLFSRGWFDGSWLSQRARYEVRS